VRLYDRLFAVPFPGAKNPLGARAEGEAADAAVLPAAAVIAGEDDDEDGALPVERNFLDDLNPASKRVITAYVETALGEAASEQRFQFERHGYFVADQRDHGAGHLVFNRTVTLRDSWVKRTGQP
jgi:glutaminyl-tRNA synthetase